MQLGDSLEAGKPKDAAAVPAAVKSQLAASPGEMRPFVKLTIRLLVAALCQAVLPLTSFVYAGMLTDGASLAGLGLGVSVCNVTGVCIFYGVGTGIDTLCAQAFGAGNNRLVGVIFARGTLLTAFTFIPVAFLWYNMEYALLTLGQQAIIAQVTGTFCRAYLWGMIPYAVFDNLKRCLQAQLIVDPPMVVGLLGVLANVAFHHLTMVAFGMGVYGAGLALSLTGMFMLTGLVACILIFRLGAEGCWSGICSLEIFRAWPEYMALCIPGLTGVFLEWTSIEASCFLAGLLGEEELATQVILLSAYSILFAAAFSISIGANIRVGNLLGAGDSVGARKAAVCALRLALASATLIALGLGLGRELWPRLYGASDDVMGLVVQVAPVYAAAQILDMMQFTCTGILKGMSLQRIQAIAAAIAFWLGAVPLSAYLALHQGWGVRGLWSGLAMAEAPLLLFYLYVLSSADWTQCATDALLRLRSHSEMDYDRQSDLCDSDSDCGGGGAVTVSIPGGEGEGLVGGEYCGGGGRAGGGGGAEMMKAVSSGGFKVVFLQKARRFPLAPREKSRLLPPPQIELMV